MILSLLKAVPFIMILALYSESRADQFSHLKSEKPGTDKVGLHRFELKDGIVSIKLLPRWKAALDLYSMPLQLLGPDHSQDQKTKNPADTEDFQAERSIIAVIPGPKDDKAMVLSEKEYQTSYQDFISNKKKDIAEMNGEFSSSFPMTHETWVNEKKESHQAIKMGVEFHIQDLYFIDYTYHVACGKQVFIIKVLSPKKSFELDREAIHEVLGSFSCE